MDDINRKILTTLQSNGNISMLQLSDLVGLSLSACHRRVKILESSGKISGYSARLDRLEIGLELQIFVEVKTVSARREDTGAFEDAIAEMPEILECHLISGDFDYLIRVATRDAKDYEKLYRNRLSMIPSVSEMKTLMTVSTIKEFTGYYLD
ncbi:MAG: winged helix-turn-helix transcriptional regulator [Boseongicola sp.]|nr:MAG: winged helix-turn-helix transcriptional regulator [Boseongicola sp.]